MNMRKIILIHRFKPAQRPHGLWCLSLWDPKFYTGCIILNFKIEFSRSRSVIVIGIHAIMICKFRFVFIKVSWGPKFSIGKLKKKTFLKNQ